jgi:hypothetical protein
MGPHIGRWSGVPVLHAGGNGGLDGTPLDGASVFRPSFMAAVGPPSSTLGETVLDGTAVDRDDPASIPPTHAIVRVWQLRPTGRGGFP